MTNLTGINCRIAELEKKLKNEKDALNWELNCFIKKVEPIEAFGLRVLSYLNADVLKKNNSTYQASWLIEVISKKMSTSSLSQTFKVLMAILVESGLTQFVLDHRIKIKQLVGTSVLTVLKKIKIK